MKTYLHAPMVPRKELLEIIKARSDLRHALLHSRNSGECLESIFGMLLPFFPTSYLFITEPCDIEDQRRVHVYPAIDGKQVLTGAYEQEYLRAAAAVSHGPLVRMGNQNDYAITITLLRNVLPRKAFSILFFRNSFPNGKLAVFGIITLGKDALNEIHCARLFTVIDLLNEYWDTGKARKKTSQRKVDSPYLELESLPGIQEVLHMLWMAGRQDFPVLLLGETGTGKEVAANTIFQCSARHKGNFIKMNCGNIPENLVDSELFGHEKGSFTGADTLHRGRFERADRGVLLLDELGELPLTAQARLLRVLQEGIIERVGGSTEVPVDVRIIAATHRNLQDMIIQGKFRQDLLYRLNIFPIHIPALRERPEDIPLLLDFFLRGLCEKQGIGNIPKISEANLRQLTAYSWPGNIRELQNAVSRSVILWSGKYIKEFSISCGDCLAPTSKLNPTSRLNPSLSLSIGSGLSENTKLGPLSSIVAAAPGWVQHGAQAQDLSLENAMYAHISKVLTLAKGKVTGKGGAAEILQINPSTLRAKMRKLGLGK